MTSENIKIPREEILKLSSTVINDISPHSLGQWLKSKTDEKYIVVPMESMKIILGGSWDASDATARISSSIEDLKENWF